MPVEVEALVATCYPAQACAQVDRRFDNPVNEGIPTQAQAKKSPFGTSFETVEKVCRQGAVGVQK